MSLRDKWLADPDSLAWLIVGNGNVTTFGGGADIAEALLANPDVVLRALGIGSREDCSDKWVCCVPTHQLTADERRNA